MKSSSKKRILRMVILDLAAFCVLAYLVCAQVFRFFPFKPVDISAGMTVLATPTPVAATPTPAPTDTPKPTDTPAPTDAPTAPASSEAAMETMKLACIQNIFMIIMVLSR